MTAEIPSEPIGTIPRLPCLIEASGDGTNPALDQLYISIEQLGTTDGCGASLGIALASHSLRGR